MCRQIKDLIFMFKLRIKYALKVLFGKNFLHDLIQYKKYLTEQKLKDDWNKGQIRVNDIKISECWNQKFYVCNFDFISYNEEACFELRRLGYLDPKSLGKTLIRK